MRNWRDLWGMAAMGLIFRLGGGLCLMVFHLTTRQQPSATRSKASRRQAAAAAGALALGWAPRSTAAWSSVVVQSRPQSTGQPCCAYSMSVVAAGWWSAAFRGIMRPLNGRGAVAGWVWVGGAEGRVDGMIDLHWVVVRGVDVVLGAVAGVALGGRVCWVTGGGERGRQCAGRMRRWLATGER